MEANKRLYNLKMPIIGVTGGIASGKSTLIDYLAKKGYFTLKADSLVKDIYQRKDTINFIKKFGVVKNNKIDFKKLRKLVFNDEKIRKNIEDFIYQKIPREFKKKIPLTDLIFYELPLLFEKNMSKYFDVVIVVLTSKNVRLTRCKKISSTTMKKIMQLQFNHRKDTSLKNTYFIFNNFSKRHFFRKIDLLLSDIISKLTFT